MVVCNTEIHKENYFKKWSILQPTPAIYFASTFMDWLLSRGQLGVTFVYLFTYICCRSRMTAVMRWYHSMASCVYKSDISASANCPLRRFRFVVWFIEGLRRLPLAAFVTYPVALHSALLYRGFSYWSGGSLLYSRAYFPKFSWFIFIAQKDCIVKTVVKCNIFANLIIIMLSTYS